MKQILLSSIAVLLYSAATVSAQTTVGTFTGGDPGEGLDLQGTFATALYASGADDGSIQVGDATFTFTDLNTGIVTSSARTPFGAPTYGNPTPSTDDLNLRLVNDYVYFAGNGNGGEPLTIDLAVTAGQQYKLQLLYNEACCNRGFDVIFEGVLAVDDFNPGIVQGGTGGGAPQDVGTVLTHTFTATDGVFNVTLDGFNTPFPDKNSIFDSLTLETVPEPGSAILALTSAAGLLTLRRRRA